MASPLPSTPPPSPLHLQALALEQAHAPARAAVAGDVLSIAPMMEWTDRHYRFLVRLLSRRTRLYSEMVVDNTLLHSPHARGYLRFGQAEHPVACQLGGSTPASLAAAARLAEEMGYDEVNLNCGCPSPRVAGKGCFGAALMLTPELVRDCVAAMRAAVRIPVTVKCRLGVDTTDSYAAFRNFVSVVAQSGCDHFVVHARKCLLRGLDPKGNRSVPPLRYAWVQRLALEFPHLRISLNGGVVTWAQAEQLLALMREPPTTPAASAEPGAEVEASAEPEAGAEPEPASGCSGCDCNEAEAGADRAAESESGSHDGDSRDGDADEVAGASTDASTNSGAGAHASEGGTKGDGIAQPGSRRGFRRFQALKAQRLAHESAAAGVGTSQLYAGHGDPNGGGEAPATDSAEAGPDAVAAAARAASRGVFPGAASPARFGRRENVLDSVMVGRAAYNNCWLFADADRRFFGQRNPGLSRREVVAAYLAYAESVRDTLPADERDMKHYRTFELAKPLIGLFNGEFGGARFRTTLSVLLQERKWPLRPAVAEALRHLPDEVLDERPPAGGAEPPAA